MLNAHIAQLAKTPADFDQARTLQRTAAKFIEKRTRIDKIRYVAGVDVGFEDDGCTARGAIAVLALPGLELVDQAVARRPVDFPYVPGYLSFREVPVLLDALSSITTTPDVLLCDGQGFAHPRRFGIACHLGVLCDMPSVGVAKSRLIGDYDEPDNERGAVSKLRVHDETIGAVLRTRVGTKPLFISIGHRIGLRKAVNLVLSCSPRYRLPETTRQAHRLASG